MADRVVRNIKDEYLTCGICLGRYTDPKLLPCGHTFCLNCLREHILQTVPDNNTTHFKCPIDRADIQRPGTNLRVKDWAARFPDDTFILSLLNAVTHHENPDTDAIVKFNRKKKAQGNFCSEHDRKLEFYCMKCNALVCAYCAIRDHKGNKCDCVSVDEALVKERSRIEDLQKKFASQIQKINVINTGDDLSELSMSMSQQQAIRRIDEFAQHVAGFYEFAMSQVEDLRQQVREAGIGQMHENQELLLILENLKATKTTFENACTDGSGPDILNLLPKMEEQADEFGTAIETVVHRNGRQVEFVPNVAFWNYLTKPPSVGVVQIMKKKHPEIDAVLNRRKMWRCRNNQRAPGQVWQTLTPRNTGRQSQGNPGNARSNRRRTKVTLNVKNPQESTSCWQLTGLAFVSNSIVVADAYNQVVRQCFIAHSAPSYIPVEYPMCVAALGSNNAVAITQPEKRLISIVGTENGLRLKDVITTIKQYEGICELDDDRFVTSCVQNKISIDIIDKNGRILKSIERSHLFRWPRFLTVTSSGNIVVSDRDQRQLVCMDRDGHVEWTYSAPAAPWGVSHDGDYRIYMCLDNNYVHVISEDGVLLNNKFATNRDGIKTPFAICANENQVAVTEYGPNLFTPNSPFIHLFNF